MWGRGSENVVCLTYTRFVEAQLTLVAITAVAAYVALVGRDLDRRYFLGLGDVDLPQRQLPAALERNMPLALGAKELTLQPIELLLELLEPARNILVGDEQRYDLFLRNRGCTFFVAHTYFVSSLVSFAKYYSVEDETKLFVAQPLRVILAGNGEASTLETRMRITWCRRQEKTVEIDRLRRTIVSTTRPP